MNKRFSVSPLLALCALALVPGCSSSDRKAAAAAGVAENALNGGQLRVARQYIQRALAERDDVGDYWLLLARIDVAMGDSAGAFDAYRMLLTFDRANPEALAALCQIAVSTNDPARAEQYADQLALLQPDSLLPPTVKAGMAMVRGDKDGAGRMIDAVLAKQADFIPALILRSKLLIVQERYAEAARTLEESMKAPGDPDSRLAGLRELYIKTGDRDNYRRTVVRFADAKPDDPVRQLAYADLLYDEGQRDAAYTLVRRVQQLKPDDIGIASSILDLWLKHGNALPADAIVRDAAGTSLETRATYAQYADEIGRPDLALQVLGADAVGGAPTEANSDAKAAFAYATALRGDRAAGLAQLGAILKVDPSHPRALIARARIAADPLAAVEDARKVVSDDVSNMVARLTLAELLLRQNDAVLAENILRAGITVNPGDPRAALRLIRLLRTQGRRDSLAAVAKDYARANPFSKQAAELGGGKAS